MLILFFNDKNVCPASKNKNKTETNLKETIQK